MADRYSIALVSRHSPKNGCLAPEGELLAVAPVASWPTYAPKHKFIGVRSGLSSRYGWTIALEKLIGVEDFLELLDPSIRRGERFAEIQETMLRAVRSMEVNKPVATDFMTRGVERKRVELVVHRVVFYSA
jgi:hypothetical protein